MQLLFRFRYKTVIEVALQSKHLVTQLIQLDEEVLVSIATYDPRLACLVAREFLNSARLLSTSTSCSMWESVDCFLLVKRKVVPDCVCVCDGVCVCVCVCEAGAAALQVVQMTGFSDPVYAEAYLNVNQYDIVLDVLVVNQTPDTLQGTQHSYASHPLHPLTPSPPLPPHRTVSRAGYAGRPQAC